MDGTDLMPFGEHAGTPMQDVPTSYLHWLWHDGLRDQPYRDVHKYVKENSDVLELDNDDLIWDW